MKKRQITLELKNGTLGSVNSLETFPEGAEAKFHENVHCSSHKAVDFYHRYKEDIDLMAEMGFNVFRFSICWSRIYPTGDEPIPNQEGIQFYNDVIDECLKYGIEPLITICHDEMPDYLARTYDGWSSRHLIDAYVKYAITLFESYKGRGKYWLTFNELNAIHGYSKIGVHKMDAQTYYQAQHHMFVASAKAIKIGHELMPNAMFGAMYALSEMYPATCDPKDVLACYNQRRESLFFSDVMARGYYPNYSKEIFKRKHVKLNVEDGDLDWLKKYPIDFISFSYYRSVTISAKHFTSWDPMGILAGDDNPYLPNTPWGWTVNPLGLRYCLNELYDRYQKPLFVIENGLGAVDELTDDGKIQDQYRVEFLSKHFKEMRDAITIDHVPCFGYTMGVLIDLVSLGTDEMKKIWVHLCRCG